MEVSTVVELDSRHARAALDGDDFPRGPSHHVDDAVAHLQSRRCHWLLPLPVWSDCLSGALPSVGRVSDVLLGVGQPFVREGGRILGQDLGAQAVITSSSAAGGRIPGELGEEARNQAPRGVDEHLEPLGEEDA